MNQFRTIVFSGLLSVIAITAAPAAQFTKVPPIQRTSPLGFSTLLCLADGLLGGVSLKTQGDSFELFGRQVMVSATSSLSTANGVSSINVQIFHGTSSSAHTITFVDRDSDGLNCGDTIVSVS